MDTAIRSIGSPRLTQRSGAVRHGAAGAQPASDDAVLSTAVGRAVERTAGQRVGRAVVVGGLVGIVVMIPAVFVMGIYAGAGPGGSLGIALFSAFWGGLGFGCMLGGIAGVTREERREADAARHTREAVGQSERPLHEPVAR